MRIHLKNVSPKVHGMITEHKASHNHDNLDETVSCLIMEAMKRFDDHDKHEDQTKLINFYIAENEKLKTALDAARMLNDSQQHKISELFDRLLIKEVA